MMRFEGLPGEFSQHDFGEVKVRFIDGSCRTVHFFASRLKWSRWVEVSLIDNQGVETLVRQVASHFTRFGGVPLCAVFDRPKTVALRWAENGAVTEWNPTFAYAALELGFTAEVCWPHQPRQKGYASYCASSVV
jgi:transposase